MTSPWRKRLAIAAAAAVLLIMLYYTVNALHSGIRSRESYTSMHNAEFQVSPVVIPAGGININTATAETLATLPQIGQKRAEAIVTEREENGAFSYP